jgi:hypothetical protein
MKPQKGSRGIALLYLGARWGGWSTPRSGRFTPGKETRYPLHERLCGPQVRSGRVWKILILPGLDPRLVQPVASRYTEMYKTTVWILLIFRCERHEGVWEKGGIGSPILNLASRWRWLVSFMLQPPYSRGQCPWYSLSRRLSVFQKCSEQFGVNKKIYGPCLMANHSSSDMRHFAHLCIPELTGAAWAGYSRIRNQRQ